MSDEKLNVEMSAAEAERVLRSGVITLDTRDAIRAALDEHRKGDRMRRLGLPWRMERYSGYGDEVVADAYVVLAAADVGTDGSNEIGLELPRDIARFVVGAPALAEALERQLDLDARRRAGRHIMLDEADAAAADARTALLESGWVETGEEQ